MISAADAAVLDAARLDLGLSTLELWLRYYSLGGAVDQLELGHWLSGGGELTEAQYDVVAHALNERFTDLGRDHPVPYAEDRPAS